MEQLFSFLTNTDLLATFPQLSPKAILVKDDKYCAVRLECEGIIPFNPETADQKLRKKQQKKYEAEEEVPKHIAKIEEMLKKTVKIDFLPWTEDARFLCPKNIEKAKAKEFDIIPETVLEEAYQHLRISFSEWLNSGTANSKTVLNQLLMLQSAKLPLFEIRRRADILLEPLIHNWLDVSEHKEALPVLSILRKNCIVLKSEASCEATPMCTWKLTASDEETDEETHEEEIQEKNPRLKYKQKVVGLEDDKPCKIKIPKTKEIPEAKIYFTSRLIDEIFRYKKLSEEIFNDEVSMIRRPVGLYRTKDYVISTKSKISDLMDEMDLKHVPMESYSAGLTFPEGAHDQSLGRKLRHYLIELPSEWAKAGIYRIPARPIDNRFLQSLIKWTDEPSIEIIKRKITEQRHEKKTHPVNWNNKDWWNFGKAYDANVFQVKYNEDEENIQVERFLKTCEKDNYVIVLYTLSEVEVLLSRKSPLQLVNLPTVFHNYLDSGISLKYEDL
jgi:hypothetical protein